MRFDFQIRRYFNCNLFGRKMDENMSRIIKLKLKIDQITSWLTSYIPLANGHMVNFIVDDNWNKFIPKPISKEIERKGCKNAVEFYWTAREYLEGSNESAASFNGSEEFPELYKFMVASWCRCVKIDNDICLSKDAFVSKMDKIWDKYRVEEFMSPKKYHEVQSMSLSVAAIAKATSATHCIDVGGGKGYLSAALAMLYGLRVLSVDCNDVSIRGAEERQAKLERLWPALLRRSNSSATASSKSYTDCYKRSTNYITQHTDLEELVTKNFPSGDDEETKPIRVCLTGLHTCGDLGAASLRLFVQSECVASLMNVPCCYNQLTEFSTDVTDLWFPLEDPSVNISQDQRGFPLSNYLRALEFNLGRNARMLTAQPIHKLVLSRNISTRSHYFRALLQVILRDEYNIRDAPEGKLRGLADKCADFDAYATEALKRLKFAPSSNCHKSKISQYSQELERLEAYCVIRLCLAPVIESLILLDRLLYLAEHEQNDSYLVKLFDPVISPRCYALVAIKANKL